MGPGFEPLRAYAKRVARLHVAVGRPVFLGNFNSRGNPWAAYFGARRSAPASAPSTSGRKVAPQGAHGPCPTPLRPRRRCRAAVRRSFCSRSALKINFECAGNKIRVRRGEIFSALKMQPQRTESFIPAHRHPHSWRGAGVSPPPPEDGRSAPKNRQKGRKSGFATRQNDPRGTSRAFPRRHGTGGKACLPLQNAEKTRQKRCKSFNLYSHSQG